MLIASVEGLIKHTLGVINDVLTFITNFLTGFDWPEDDVQPTGDDDDD